MTLNGRDVTHAEIKKFYGARQKIINEDRPIQIIQPIVLVTSISINKRSVVRTELKGDAVIDSRSNQQQRLHVSQVTDRRHDVI